MAKISFYSDDMEATISIPAEWEICDGCQGEGAGLIPIQNDSEGYKLWEDIQRAAYESRATELAERAMGC